VPATGATLPFAVDVGGTFIPDGEGEAAAVIPPGAIGYLGKAGDPTCNGERANPSAIGNCLIIGYSPLPATAMVYGPGGVPGPAAGWAGMAYQHPDQGWGTMPGFAMPAGATKVTFWAKGAVGGEVVSFSGPGLGYGNLPTTAAPCVDTVTTTALKQTLTTTWTQYTLPIQGTNYSGGVLQAFYFSVAKADQATADGGAGATDAGAGDAGSSAPLVTFYLDDIRWDK
jgi:hypothetical protein